MPEDKPEGKCQRWWRRRTEQEIGHFDHKYSSVRRIRPNREHLSEERDGVAKAREQRKITRSSTMQKEGTWNKGNYSR
jgi:hypothetical protein